MAQIEVGVCKELEVLKIKPSKFNAREEKEAIDSDEFRELCDSIKENGLIEPIVVRKIEDDGHYEAIAGTRRLRAFKHLGIQDAPVVLRKMNDNDVRIASLVENIHRKGLNNEEKKSQIEEIYDSAGFKDLSQVTKWLNLIHFRRYRKSKLQLSQLQIPDGFEALVNRIAYSPTYQFQLLRGYGDIRPNKDTNYLAELDDELRKKVESNPVLKKHPRIRQHVAQKAKGKTPKKVQKIIEQTVHDVKTGAIEEDEEADTIAFHPSKHENITRPETEMNPAEARDEIISLCRKLYKTITGIPLNMSDPSQAEKQITALQQIRNNITEICTYELQKREKRALQDAVLPTLKALDKLADEIERTEK